MEAYAGTGDGVYCTNAVTEIVLEENATLEHYRLLREGAEAFHIGTVQVRQARNSRYRSHAVTSGGAMTRVEINALLDGEGADCLLQGLYVAGGAQHVDNRTAIEHAKPHGSSRELYKGVLDGRARAVFKRQGRRAQGGPEDRRATVQQEPDAVPGRGNRQQAPVGDPGRRRPPAPTAPPSGQLEENELFYLRSRGLNQALARKLLVHGFAGEILDGIDIEPLRDGLTSQVFSELGA